MKPLYFPSRYSCLQVICNFVPLRISVRLYHHEACVSKYLFRCVYSIKITNYFEVKNAITLIGIKVISDFDNLHALQ
jgi:hypothetical protein